MSKPYKNVTEINFDFSLLHQPSWQSEKFKTCKRKLDSKFMDTCSVKSRRLLTKRTIGCDAIKEAPNLQNETLSWILKDYKNAIMIVHLYINMSEPLIC